MNTFRKGPAPIERKKEEGLIAKLVEYPQEIWDFLKEQKGLFVPEGRFSPKYFAKNLLPFSFVKEISMGAKKKLCIMLLKEMINFDSTMARNFRDSCYTEEDREVFGDIAAMLDDYVEDTPEVGLVDKVQA